MACCSVFSEFVFVSSTFLAVLGSVGADQHIQRTSYNFITLKSTTVVTSSGNLTSQGRVTLLTSSHSQPVLDLQGKSLVTFPPHKCLQNSSSCEKGFTITTTFRITHTQSSVTSSRIYVFDCDLKRHHHSGLTLYSERGSVTCVLVWGRYVWKVKVQQGLVEGVWHQLHVSWHPVLGLTVWAGSQMLGSQTYSEPRQDTITTTTTTMATTMKGMAGPTTLDDGGASSGDGANSSGSDGGDCDGGSGCGQGQLRLGSEKNEDCVRLQVSGVTISEAFITDLLIGGLDDFFPVSKPPSPSATPVPTVPTLTESSETIPTHQTTPQLRKTSVRFLAIAGQQLLMTSLGVMKSHGDVTMEPVPAGFVLVLNGSGEFIELGPSLSCLLDVSSCTEGFFLRMTFEFLEGSPPFSVLLSSGGDQPDSSGVTLAYSDGQLLFMVKTNTTTWAALYAAVLQPGLWYTLDASWDGHSNTTMYINNLPVSYRTMYSGSHTLGPPGQVPSSTRHPVLLGTGPGYPGTATTRMKVFGVDFWTADRMFVSPQELNLPILPDEPEVTMPSERNSTEPWQTKDDPSLTSSAATKGKLGDEVEKEGGVGRELEADNYDRIVIIVLATLSTLFFIVGVVGGLWCWKSRRQARKLVDILSSQQRSRSLSVDYAFRSRPTAFHSRSFSQGNDDLIY